MYMRFLQLLKNYVGEQVELGKPLPDEELLTFFRKKWNDYRVSNQISNSMLAYLNRTWVKTQKSNNADVYEVNMLADVVWKDSMFMPLHKRLTNSMLALIKLDRDGERINTAVIADTTQCLIRLGQNKENVKQSSLEVYKTFFEKEFLKATDVFYTVESTNFINENGVSEYMKKVETRLAEETQRLRTYLHHTTEQPLKEKLDDVLIKRHMAAMHARAPDFLNEMQRDDLARMYTLLSRLGAAGLDPMRAALETHVAAAGRHALAAEVETAKDEPDVFVAILLRVFRKYQQLIKESLVEDAGFIAAQDKAFRDFINNNAITQADDGDAKKGGGGGGDGSVAKAPQLLAKYCDMILRKGAKHISDEAEMERTLDDVVSLFKYLPDKDVFMLVYKKLLSKRLISDQSGNDDFEAAMINKLKTAQGFEYTSSLQRMVQDIATSKDINSAFKDWCEQNNEKVSLDLSISVLATGTWPLQPAATQFVAPQALVGPIDLFKKFYSTKYSGRKLSYLHHLGKVELVVNYAMKGRLRVTVSTFQLGVLVHFDTADSDTVTFGDLCSAMLLQEQQMKMALLAMLKLKFISCAAGAKHTTWDESTEFSLVKNFKSARNRINLNVPVAADGLKSAPQAQVEAPEVRREREMKLQAAIVRTMKARKTMTHQLLISEATLQVQKWFTPKVATIKKVIESLIESEYLARDTDEANPTAKSYRYLA
jgi:cullin 1